MSPFILPLVLLLYGEFSKDIDTRFVARILFYTQILAVYLPMYVPLANQGLLLGAMLSCGGLAYCIITCKNYTSKTVFCISLVCCFLNYSSIYFKDFTFILSIPYYKDYSHMIIRECMLTGVANMTLHQRDRWSDAKVSYIVVMIYVLEFVVL